MKARLNVALAAGMAVVLATGCVSSKKYHASQNALSQMRADSAQQAQQIASLNQNVQSLQDKNTSLQQNLDKTNSDLANQQKSLGYYKDYFSQQQTAMTQVSDELKSSLTQAGVADADIQQVDNVIYVRLSEGSVFKKNSTECTQNGKQALMGIANVIKTRDNVNVFVNDGDSTGAVTTSSSATTSTGMSDNTTAGATTTRHHWHKRSWAKKTTSTDANAAGSNAASSSVATTETTPKPAHKKVHRRYSSESGSMTYYSNSGKHNAYWSLKQRRMGTVANSFLKNGVNKVHITLRQPDMNSNIQSNTIKVVIMPKMTDFNPQNNSTTSK